MTTTDPSHALDHVIVVLFENRSFDNVLGRLYGTDDGKDFEGRPLTVQVAEERGGGGARGNSGPRRGGDRGRGRGR